MKHGLIFLYSSILHTLIGILHLVDAPVGMAVGMQAVHTLTLNPMLGGLIYLTSTACSLIGCYAPRLHAIVRLACFLPQQSLLIMSALEAIQAVVTQQYTDGVLRAWAFILADQLPRILLATCHSHALIESALAWRVVKK